MKYIKVLEDIPIFNLSGDRMIGDDGSPAIVTFRQFVLGRLGDPKFSEDIHAIIAAVEIKKQLDYANGVLALENDHHQRLAAVTERPSPQSAYHPAVAFNLLPYMQAITNPADAPPEKT